MNNIKLAKIISTQNRLGVIRAQVQLVMEVADVTDYVVLLSNWGDNANPPAGTPCLVFVADNEYSKKYAIPFNLNDAIKIALGERVIYTSDTTKIHLKEDGGIDIIASDDSKEPSINMTATTAVNITAPTVNINGDCNATGVYKVADTQVVGPQGASIADPAGGATVDTEARAAIALILTAMETHGLIAT